MKNTKQNDVPSSTVFEVHTMQSDNVARTAQPSQQNNTPAPTENPLLKTTSAPTPSTEPNPFLSDLPTGADSIGKKTFAPTASDGPEKINYDISDIADTQSAPTENTTPQKSSSMGKKVLIILVGVLCMALVAGGVYYFFFMRPAADVTSPAETPPPVTDTPTQPTDTAPKTTTYFLDMPNYFTVDINSPAASDDIAKQLTAIRTNLPQQSPEKPVVFIVTDATSTPISFHQFALAAKLSLTEDVLSVLNKDFELHAYNDPEAGGIRFGLVVNAKDPIALQSALRAHENILPQALTALLPADTTNTSYPITFADNAYYGKALRYANLDAEETASIDYAVFNNQWLVGTSKNTLRALFDAIHEKTSHQEPPSDFTY